MGLFGGSKTVTASNIDPRLYGLFEENLGRAKGIANQPFQEFGGPLVAQPGAATQAGQDYILGRAANVGGGLLNAAGNTALWAANTPTPQIGAIPSLNAAFAPNVSAGAASTYKPVSQQASMTGAQINVSPDFYSNLSQHGADLRGIEAYYNPYLKDVIDPTMADLSRLQQNAIAEGQSRAAMSGAYGGSRHGVADAETNRAFSQTAGQTVGGLRAGGFNTAAGLQQADRERAARVAMANQAAQLAIATGNAGYAQQANLVNADTGRYNATAANQAAQFNAGNANTMAQYNAGLAQDRGMAGAGAMNTAQAGNLDAFLRAAMANQNAAQTGTGQRIGAAGMLGDISNRQQQQFLTGGQAMLGVGAQQDAIRQAEIDRAYEQYLRRFNYPYQTQDLLNSSLGLFDTAKGSLSVGQQEQPNILASIGALLGGGAKAYGVYKGG